MFDYGIIGQKFGHWTVLSLAGENRHGQTMYSCGCDCGGKKSVTGTSLVNGYSTSCGCKRTESIRKAATKHGQSNRNKTLEYTSWASMIQRCTNPNHINYDLYGGRGITVCERWRDFKLFFEDMGNRPSKNHSLDRIDVNEGYELGNCRWATRAEQMQNTQKIKEKNNGIHWEERTKKWRARLSVNNKTVHLGRFKNFEDAVKARKDAELKYWGKSS